MLEKHLTTTRDFKAIEKALEMVFSGELKFVFPKRDLIKKTTVISFDSQNLYLWSPFNLPNTHLLKKYRFAGYKLFKKSHKVKTNSKMQKGWQKGIKSEFLETCAPLNLNPSNWAKKPVICGSLLTPFIRSHQEIRKTTYPKDPYHTYQSYLATIVHEFAHVYYHLHKLWWFANKKENLAYLRTAQGLYEGRGLQKGELKITIPSPYFFSEVFAFCCEYYTSFLFWPNHLRNLNIANASLTKKLIELERRKDLDKEDSVLDSKTHSHHIAIILGKLLIQLYPQNWPKKLLTRISL